MNVPANTSEFETILSFIVPDADARAMILQFLREEWRRGYLHGRRDMKQQVENAIASIRMDES